MGCQGNNGLVGVVAESGLLCPLFAVSLLQQYALARVCSAFERGIMYH